MDNQHAQKVKAILMNHFNVDRAAFSWDKPLDDLNKDFALLGNLAQFEAILQNEIGAEVQIIEHISTNFHTPEDVVNLIRR